MVSWKCTETHLLVWYELQRLDNFSHFPFSGFGFLLVSTQNYCTHKKQEKKITQVLTFSKLHHIFIFSQVKIIYIKLLVNQFYNSTT